MTGTKSDGRVADLHSLRVSLGTTLARLGVPSATTQRLMRHASYCVTIRLHVQLDGADARGAILRAPGAPDVVPPAIASASSKYPARLRI